MTDTTKIQEALNIVQHNLSLFNSEDAEILQTGIYLWVYAPRLLAALKTIVSYDVYNDADGYAHITTSTIAVNSALSSIKEVQS